MINKALQKKHPQKNKSYYLSAARKRKLQIRESWDTPQSISTFDDVTMLITASLVGIYPCPPCSNRRSAQCWEVYDCTFDWGCICTLYFPKKHPQEWVTSRNKLSVSISSLLIWLTIKLLLSRKSPRKKEKLSLPLHHSYPYTRIFSSHDSQDRICITLGWETGTKRKPAFAPALTYTSQN